MTISEVVQEIKLLYQMLRSMEIKVALPIKVQVDNVQCHPIKMGCCNTKEKGLIVTTINPIWHSHPVHPGIIFLQFVALKARKTSSLHTIILETQTQTKHLLALIFI